MPRFVKNLACLLLLASTAQLSWGFSLLGPFNEPYQVAEIGYQLPGDIGAPKNLGEEYRWNKPVLYYSYDANFLDYFGSNGVAAVDSAMAMLNSLTNVSKLSVQLNEYPLQATRENYLAEALSLYDLKTWALKAMVEQLGLAEPERYAWTLHDRAQIPNSPPCPVGMVYSVVLRNFDPAPTALNQFQETPYVNGTLYSYYIVEGCQPPNPLAVTIPFPVDPLDFTFTAVASLPTTTSFLGLFHTSLTRDDVGGLRYMLDPNNFNFESAGSNSVAEVTNPVPQLLFTSNLTLFASQALTNDAPTLIGLYPNLTIINSSNYFVNVLLTNVTPYFTNFPWAPAGSTTLAYATNLTPFVQTRYVHVFGNVLVLTYSSSGQPMLVPLSQIPRANGLEYVTIEKDTIGSSPSPFGPAGSITISTNTTFTTYVTNALVGDYFILPTNLCGIDVLYGQLTNVTTSTNFLLSITNTLSLGNTNSASTNVTAPTVINYSEITYTTNHAFVVLEANCVPSGAALFGGVDHLTFVRRDFDSLLGRFFQTITNNYSLNSLTNNTIVPEPIQRTVAQPDFLMTARDFAPGPAAYPPGGGIWQRGITFNTAFANATLAGPGTIEPPTSLAFQKVGPIYFNTYQTAFFAQTAEAGQVPITILGSFDGTTNAPIVYPNGTSIVNLENQMLIGISPGTLPDAQVGVPYANGNLQLTATGGQVPYTWSLAPNSPGLPPGLFLLPNGTIGGTPTQDGTFDFSVLLTDGGGRTIVHPYFITIAP